MAGSDDNWTNRAADTATEAAVIQHLLAVFPIQLTVAEVVRELTGKDPSFAESDAVERAVRDLAGAGLLRRSDELVTPTLAALRFSELIDR